MYNPAHTVLPRSSDPFYIVSYHIKWGTTSWTYSMPDISLHAKLNFTSILNYANTDFDIKRITEMVLHTWTKVLNDIYGITKNMFFFSI